MCLNVAADSAWTYRPHRPVSLALRADAVRCYQLTYRSHQRLPTSLPFGPRPQAQDWRVSRDIAESAARAALERPVGEAWELLTLAWKYFANELELELESFTGVEVRSKGHKGDLVRARWVPILSKPKAYNADSKKQGLGVAGSGPV